MASFQSKVRVPTRPLAYENIDLAVNKELIIDYNTGNVYVKDTVGNIHDITASIKEAVSNEIAQDPSIIVNNIKINITDPDTGEVSEVTIDGAVAELATRISANKTSISELNTAVENLNTDLTETNKTLADTKTALEDSIAKANENISSIKEIINIIEDPENPEAPPTVELPAENIKLDDTHQFVTNEEKEKIATIDNKIEVNYQTLVIPVDSWVGTEAPYSATVAAEWAKADMLKPIMDLICSNYYETAVKESDGYVIYKAVTSDGSITFYNMVKPEVDLTVSFEIKSIAASSTSTDETTSTGEGESTSTDETTA